MRTVALSLLALIALQFTGGFMSLERHWPGAICYSYGEREGMCSHGGASWYGFGQRTRWLVPTPARQRREHCKQPPAKPRLEPVLHGLPSPSGMVTRTIGIDRTAVAPCVRLHAAQEVFRCGAGNFRGFRPELLSDRRRQSLFAADGYRESQLLAACITVVGSASEIQRRALRFRPLFFVRKFRRFSSCHSSDTILSSLSRISS